MAESPVAIVTGATGGIGHALAGALDARGFRVVVHGHDTVAAGQKLAAALRDAVAVDADLSTPAGAEAVRDAALTAFGRIDLVINNAGIGVPVEHRDLDAVSPEFFDRMLSVNLVGPWLLIQATAAELRRTRGSIINVSSVAGSTVSGSSIPYAVSKAALEHLTRLLAVAMGPEVRVNAVAPGFVETERTRDWTELRDRITASAPLARTGRPEDVALACLALLDSPYTTGAVLPVDGGLGLV